jgi:hypothetical protein
VEWIDLKEQTFCQDCATRAQNLAKR